MSGVEQDIPLDQTLAETNQPASPSADFEPGIVVGDRYRVISQLGRGGMGVVYKVEQILVGEILALKTLSNHAAFDIAFKRFQHEAKAAFALDHPNMISVHDFGVLEDGTPFLVMEFVQGPTLQERLKQVGHLSIEEAVPLFVQACFGLYYAHEKGVAHRDIKPSNILLNERAVSEQGVVKIVDFGLAKFLQHEGGEIQSLTRTGEIFGSPLYMSPEQCLGGRVDQRTDVYSLGCVLFEALTGTPPHVGDNILATLMMHQSDRAPTLKEASMGREFPEALELIVAKMLAKAPEDRYQSMSTAANDLMSVFRGDLQNITMRLSPLESEEADGGSRVSMPVRDFYALIAILVCASSVLSYFIASYVHDRTVVAMVETPVYATTDIMTQHGSDSLGLPPVSTFDFFDKMAKSNVDLERAVAGGVRNRIIHFHYRQLTAGMLNRIVNVKWITGLDMLACSIDNASLSKFAGQPISMALLKFSNLDDTGIAGMKSWKNLNTLEIRGTRITDKAAPMIAKMPRIRKLDVGETKITDQALMNFGRMKGLRELILAEVRGITYKGLSALADSDISYLDLTRTDLNDECIPYLIKMHDLEILNLSRTRVTVLGVSELLKKSRRLKDLYIAECPYIKPKEVYMLADRFSSRKVSGEWPHGKAPIREMDDPVRKLDF